MLVYNILYFLAGIICAVLAAVLLICSGKPKKSKNISGIRPLDDVDEMVLWGEVNDDSFYDLN